MTLLIVWLIAIAISGGYFFYLHSKMDSESFVVDNSNYIESDNFYKEEETQIKPEPKKEVLVEDYFAEEKHKIVKYDNNTRFVVSANDIAEMYEKITPKTDSPKDNETQKEEEREETQKEQTLNNKEEENTSADSGEEGIKNIDKDRFFNPDDN